jgi:shikimate kinase
MLGGIGGGIAQAYATMGKLLEPLAKGVKLMAGFCTCMKTVEITRHKQASVGAPVESTFKVFQDIYKREGLAGINKGVNAVAVRQATNWGSRMGFARLAEQSLRKARGINEGEKLGAFDKILASTVGGALATWNQPIEVVRVEVSPIHPFGIPEC